MTVQRIGGEGREVLPATVQQMTVQRGGKCCGNWAIDDSAEGIGGKRKALLAVGNRV